MANYFFATLKNYISLYYTILYSHLSNKTIEVKGGKSVIIPLMKTYVFIDASNLFYGGEKSLGWKIDYKKLFAYLKEKYEASRIFYFGGVEIHNFKYDYQKDDTVPIAQLEIYLLGLIENKEKEFNEAEILLLGRHLQRVRFYLKLLQFGYRLFLKPVTLYDQEDGTTKRKPNC